jgi:CubicO group peptidase (beta-lactamase class C family)
MLLRWTLLLFTVWLLSNEVSLNAASAPATPPLPSTFDIPALDAYLSAQVQQASRVGWSLAIIKNGHLVFAKGYGKRALEDGRPVETNTVFAIGSVTKQFTCACVLLLAEDGKLSLQDSVSKYYPQFTRAKDITLLDLMQHVSGYPDYYPLDFVDRRMAQSIQADALLERYAGGKLDFEPGAQFSYSNTGYILLGRVVEKVSGQSLGDFLRQRIFQPLGMNDTFYELAASDPRLARGYTTFLLSPPETVAPEASGWLGGAGGIYSTPMDLAKWNLALMDGRVLGRASFAQMTAPRTLSNKKVSDYGCGLALRVQNGRQVWSHNGAVSGFNAWSAMVPSTRSSVIMVCNVDGGLGAVPGQIFGLLLKEPTSLPQVAGPSAVETVKDLFSQFRKSKVNREQLGEEYNLYLTPAKLTEASKRLRPYRSLKKVELVEAHERGGMEVSTTRLTFANGVLRALMYRMPDGKVEQYFLSAD